MEYDHEPRGGGGGAAGLILVVIGALAILVLMGVAFFGYFMFNRMEATRDAEMEMVRRAAKAQAMAAEKAAEREAADAEAAALAAKKAADARRLEPPPPDLGEELVDGMVPAEKIKRLQEQLALLQQRFDRRVADDERMLKSMRDQLETTRSQLEQAYAKIRALEEEQKK